MMWRLMLLLFLLYILHILVAASFGQAVSGMVSLCEELLGYFQMVSGFFPYGLDANSNGLKKRNSPAAHDVYRPG